MQWSNIFAELCNCHHNFGTFSSPQKETPYSLTVTHHFPHVSFHHGSCNKLLQTWWLKTTEMYSSLVQRVRGPTSRVRVLPSGDPEAATTQASSYVLGAAGSPCCSLACSCLTLFTASVFSGLFPLCLSKTYMVL